MRDRIGRVAVLDDQEADMKPREPELASLGAEALPGGLPEIIRAEQSRPDAARQIAPRQPRLVLKGLIAIAADWMTGRRAD